MARTYNTILNFILSPIRTGGIRAGNVAELKLKPGFCAAAFLSAGPCGVNADCADYKATSVLAIVPPDYLLTGSDK